MEDGWEACQQHKAPPLQDSAIPTFAQSGALGGITGSQGAGGGKCPGRAEGPWGKQENGQEGDKSRAQYPGWGLHTDTVREAAAPISYSKEQPPSSTAPGKVF